MKKIRNHCIEYNHNMFDWLYTKLEPPLYLRNFEVIKEDGVWAHTVLSYAQNV